MANPNGFKIYQTTVPGFSNGLPLTTKLIRPVGMKALAFDKNKSDIMIHFSFFGGYVTGPKGTLITVEVVATRGKSEQVVQVKYITLGDSKRAYIALTGTWAFPGPVKGASMEVRWSASNFSALARQGPSQITFCTTVFSNFDANASPKFKNKPKAPAKTYQAEDLLSKEIGPKMNKFQVVGGPRRTLTTKMDMFPAGATAMILADLDTLGRVGRVDPRELVIVQIVDTAASNQVVAQAFFNNGDRIMLQGSYDVPPGNRPNLMVRWKANFTGAKVAASSNISLRVIVQDNAYAKTPFLAAKSLQLLSDTTPSANRFSSLPLACDLKLADKGQLAASAFFGNLTGTGSSFTPAVRLEAENKSTHAHIDINTVNYRENSFPLVASAQLKITKGWLGDFLVQPGWVYFGSIYGSTIRAGTIVSSAMLFDG